MSRKFLTPIDLTGLEILNARFQNLATAPTPKGKGHVYYNTTDDTVYVYDGTRWTASGKISAGVLADRPAAGANGRLYFATDATQQVLYYDNGTTWTQVGIGAQTTDTLKNKTLEDVNVTGTTHFQSGGDDYLTISRSGTGTARITAADDLALRATNDLILYPGNDVNGHPGKAYIHWGDDSWNAYPEREIATIGTEQVFRGKAFSDNLHFRDGVTGDNIGYVHADVANLEVIATDGDLNLDADQNVNINTTNGNIVLNADGNAYLVSSADPNNRIATMGDLANEGINSVVGGDNITVTTTSGEATVKLNDYVNIAYDLNVGSDAELEVSHDAALKLYGADGTTTFESSSVTDETNIKGRVGFKNSSDVEKAHFEHSGTGTFRIIADEDLALRAQNGDVILYPGTEGGGGTGRAYVGWGNDASDAGLGNEILTRDANQIITNKTVNDELYFTNPSTNGEDGGIYVDDTSEEFVVKAYNSNLIATATGVNADVILNAPNGDIYKTTNASDDNILVTRGDEVTLTNKTLGSGTLLGADLDANEYKIVNLADPQDDYDAANKRYVDAATAGLTWKQAVNVHVDSTASTALGLFVDNGFLTSTLVGGVLVIDGHTIVNADAGYRILVSGTNSTKDGIWVLDSVAELNWLASRAADADVFSELKGAAVFVMEGTNYGSTSWVQSSHYITSFVGQTWAQFSGQGTYTAGDGLELNGSEFTVKLDGDAGLSKSANGLKLDLAEGSGLDIDGGLYINAGTGLTVNGSNELTISSLVARKFADSVGNGVLTSFVLTHNFNTRDVAVTVYDVATHAEVFADVSHSTVDTVTIAFAEAPTTDQYRVVIVG